MIVGVTHDTVNLAIVLAIRIRGEQFLTFADHFLVFILDKINLRDIVQGSLFIIRQVLQAGKFHQGIVVFTGCVIDISDIIGRRFPVLRSNLLDPCEITTGLLDIPDLQQGISQTETISLLLFRT